MSRLLTGLSVLPPDEAFHLSSEFRSDEHPQKANLAAGIYRDGDGEPWVLPSVRKAEAAIQQDRNYNHEYLGIQGSSEFLDLASRLVFGPSKPPAEGVITSIQTVAGTGANHLGALFLRRHLRPRTVFIPRETWLNHHLVWETAAPDINRLTYPYYGDDGALDFAGLVYCLETQSHPGDVVILHPCCHNPTGVDPTETQWTGISEVIIRKHLVPFFDSAYQGFASGDVEQDAWSIRYFRERLFSGTGTRGGVASAMCVAQSFSKNFGLYGERVGAFHLVTDLSIPSDGVASQLKRFNRAEISNPPLYGTRIVCAILSDPTLKAQWQEDLGTMVARLQTVRSSLVRVLKSLGARGDWKFLELQKGMFSMVPAQLLNETQIKTLQEKYHIYILKSGRISLTGLNERNIGYVARAITDITSEKRVREIE